MATKYDRIAADLRLKITRGELSPGQQMPIETALMDDYRVSLATMRRALSQLAAEGLIEKLHGRGTFVKTPRQRVRRASERHQWEKDQALLPLEQRHGVGSAERDTGLEMSDLDFRAEYHDIEADAYLAGIFKVDPGTRLLERIYRTKPKKEDAPLSIGRSFVLYDILAQNPDLLDVTNEPWPGGTQHQLSTVGVELDRIEETLVARPATADEAEELGIDPGSAVIALRKVSIDTSDHVIEVAESVFSGDRTEMFYVIKLDRWTK